MKMQQVLLQEKKAESIDDGFVRKLCVRCFKFTPHKEKGFEGANYRTFCAECGKGTKFVSP